MWAAEVSEDLLDALLLQHARNDFAAADVSHLVFPSMLVPSAEVARACLLPRPFLSPVGRAD
jgi:hypothetical protein